MKVKLLAIAAIAAVLAIAGIQCAGRMKKTDVLAARLAEAVMSAQSSLPRFRNRLTHPAQPDRAFFVRAEFLDPNKRTEYLWLNRVQPAPGGFKARVAEAPFSLRDVKLGSEVVVTDDQVVDWTIVHDDGSREGNFTQGLEPTKH